MFKRLDEAQRQAQGANVADGAAGGGVLAGRQQGVFPKHFTRPEQAHIDFAIRTAGPPQYPHSTFQQQVGPAAGSALLQDGFPKVEAHFVCAAQPGIQVRIRKKSKQGIAH